MGCGPALLIETNASGETPRASITLRHLSVVFGADCEITGNFSAVKHGAFTVIRVVGGDVDDELKAHFLGICALVIARLGISPAPDAIGLAVDRLVELFRSLSQSARKTVQGLWAEVFLIAVSTAPGKLIDCWHDDPTELYDFHAGKQRIEVKSSRGERRVHVFQLGQLTLPEGASVVIASVRVDPASGGDTVGDLLNQIGDRGVTAEQWLRAYEVVSQTLGDEWEQAAPQRFDRQRGLAELAFYRAEDIPQVDPVLPPGVPRVSFTSDLSGVASLSSSDLSRTSGLLADAVVHP